MSPARRTAYFVPHTHWDREWYQPFQVFRARLVDVVDRVLELLERRDYRRFTLDGQAVVLDDYLEIRPEREADVARHVRSGRLRIGPWFVLADEFLVSPESLIRNLALGRDTCLRFGPPMPVAYTPDSFGHISQLPLIVRGFGMDAIVFERGVGDEGERLRGEFTWETADGESSVFAVHLPGTYSSAAAIGHVDWELSDPYDAARAVRQIRSVLYGSDDLGPEFPTWLRESVERLEGGIDAYATGEALLLLNGSDHLFPQPNVSEIIADLNAAFDDVTFVHADVEEFVQAARAQDVALETYRGEFRGSRYQHVLPGVLSARVYLKQANRRVETLLERYAEPLTVIAALQGAPDVGPLLRSAWRTLLLNHAHDSICGCSVDAVHREMLTRFEQVTQLGGDLCRRAIDHLAGHRDDPRDERLGTSHVALFNALPSAIDAVMTTDLLLPPGSAASLRVRDASGFALPTQVEARPATAPGDARIAREAVRLTFAATLPPLGVTSVRIDRDADAPPPEHERGGVSAEPADDGVVVENDALRVEVDAQGAIVLHDRTSGHVHALDLRFEDEADAGDEYDFSPVPDDVPILVSGTREAPTVRAAGPLRATVRLPYRLTLPQRLADDRRSRVGAALLDVDVDLTLDAGSSRLDVTVALDNRVDDHRLRLRVATGCAADHVWADGHFHVLERPVTPPAGEGWFQRPTGTSHQRRFVAVTDGERGLAVLNRGLNEYQAHLSAEGVDLAVTLLRCVGWLSRDDALARPQGAGPALATPEAQCHGPQRFELAIVPFGGRWWEGALLLEAERFAAPPLALAAAAAVQAPGLELDAPLTLSSYAPARGSGRSAIVRIWNPAPVTVSGRLAVHHPLHEVHLVRLDETRESALEHVDGVVDVTLAPAAVISLELVFADEEVSH